MNAAEACKISKSLKHYYDKVMSCINEQAKIGNTEATFRDAVAVDYGTFDYFVYTSSLVDSCLLVRHILESEGYEVIDSVEKTTLHKRKTYTEEKTGWFGTTSHKITRLVEEPAMLRVLTVRWCCNE